MKKRLFLLVLLSIVAISILSADTIITVDLGKYVDVYADFPENKYHTTTNESSIPDKATGKKHIYPTNGKPPFWEYYLIEMVSKPTGERVWAPKIVSITIPDGATAEDVAAITETAQAIVDAESALNQALDDADLACGDIPANLTEVANALTELENSLSALSDLGAGITGVSIDDYENLHSPVALDPVRLATGSFITSNIDFTMSNGSVPVDVERKYRSDAKGYRSLGPGWSSNIDQRIVFGIEYDAQSIVDAYQLYYSDVKTAAETARTLYDTNLSSVNTIITDVSAVQSTLIDKIASLQAYKKNHSNIKAKVLQKINSRISTYTTQKTQTIDPFLQRAIDTRDTLEELEQVVLELEAKMPKAFDKWQEALELLNLAINQKERNKYNLGSDAPRSWTETGYNSITFLDSESIPHLLYTETAPEYDVEYFYENGERNFFPNGAEYFPPPNSSDDLKVFLNPDGTLHLLYTKTNITYNFNYWGLLESITDINGNAQTYVYNESNWTLDYIIDGFGRKIDVTISGGKLVSIKDPLNQTISYTYDSQGRLESVTDRDNDTLSYRYSGKLLTEIIKPDQSSRKYTYETIYGKTVVTKTEDEEGNNEYLAYDFLNRVTFVTSNEGVVTKHHYDERNLETRVEYPDNSSEYKEYDEDNNLIKYTSRTGNTTAYLYDENRNLVYVYHPDGTSESRSYNYRNQVTLFTDSEGNQFSFDFDEKGNMIQSNVSHANTLQPVSFAKYSYNEKGQLLSTIRGPHNNGGTVTEQINYDSYGNIDYIIDGEFQIWDYEYNELGQMKSTTDPKNNKTAFTYTGSGKIKSISYPDATDITYEYTNRKDIDYITHQDETITDYQYDKKHRLKYVINAEGEKTEYFYRNGESIESVKVFDATGKLASQADFEYEYATGEIIRKKRYLGDISEQDGSEYLQWRQDLPNNSDDQDWAVTDYSYINGMLNRVIDPRGYESYFSYDEFDRVRSKTRYGDPGDQPITEYFDYNAKGDLKIVTNPRGYNTKITYNANRQITIVENTDGTDIEISYDGLGNPIEQKDEIGTRTYFTYNRNNKLTKTKYADDSDSFIEYDAAGIIDYTIDQNKTKLDYQTDEMGRVTKVLYPNPYSDSYEEVKYDKMGRVKEQIDANGNSTVYEYDAVGRVKSIKNPLDVFTSFKYNVFGKVVEMTDVEEFVWKYEYDFAGQLLKTINPKEETDTYAYDTMGNVVREINALGDWKADTYDAFGRLVKSSQPEDISTSYTYDKNSNVTELIQSEDEVYNYSYDNMDRLILEQNRLGDTQSFKYYNNSSVKEKTDFNGLTTVFEYDDLNRLKKETYSTGGIKTLDFDPVGNLLSAENESGKLIYEYDSLNRLKQYTDSEKGIDVTYTYDSAGNRTSLTWGDSRSTSYKYNDINLPESVTDNEGLITEIKYDNLGREKEIKQPNGVTTSKTYDEAGRLLTTVNTKEKGWRTEFLDSYAYAYNEAGQRIMQVDEKGRLTTYEYDTAGRLVTAKYPLSTAKGINDLRERLSLGLLPDVSFPGKSRNLKRFFDQLEDVYDEYPELGTEFDAEDWYKDIFGQFEDLSEFFPDYENLFDFDKRDKGRNSSWNDDKDFKWEEDASTGLSTSWKNRKGGNAWGKLKSGWWKNFEWGKSFNWKPGKSGWKNHGKGNDKIPNGNAWGRHFNTDWIFNMPKWEETFSYDGSGNITEKANFWGKIDYEYNAENQLLKAGERTYGYDKNGNLTSEMMNSMTTNYSYNELNRVIEVLHQTPGFNRKEHWKTPNGVAYTYDALGRRNSRKVISELINGKHRDQFGKKEDRTSTLYDSLSFNILAESVDGKGSGRNNGWSSSSSKSFNPVTEYVNVNGKILVSTSTKNSHQNLIENNRHNSLDKTYFSHDILGSVILKTSKKGNRIMSHEYDAYGNMIEGRFTTSTQLGYNEKEMDLMTGWYNYGYRDYSPVIMQFTTIDPIRDGMNWYGFVSGDPINRIDLYGLDANALAGTAGEILQYADDVPIPAYAAGVIVAAGVVAAGALIWKIGEAIFGKPNPTVITKPKPITRPKDIPIIGKMLEKVGTQLPKGWVDKEPKKDPNEPIPGPIPIPDDALDDDTILYRKGSGNDVNLTPRVKDEAMSYQLNKPVGTDYTMTTTGQLNATGCLYTVFDGGTNNLGPDHVSVYAYNQEIYREWQETREKIKTANALGRTFSPHPYTTVLKSISTKVKKNGEVCPDW